MFDGISNVSDCNGQDFFSEDTNNRVFALLHLGNFVTILLLIELGENVTGEIGSSHGIIRPFHANEEVPVHLLPFYRWTLSEYH